MKNNNIDFYQVKQQLLNDYRTEGGSSETEFVRGMNWLEDYIASQNEPTNLNMEVPEKTCIRQLNEKVGSLTETNERLQRELRNKNNIIASFRHMSREERREYRLNTKFVELERTYTRMVQSVLTNRNGKDRCCQKRNKWTRITAYFHSLLSFFGITSVKPIPVTVKW